MRFILAGVLFLIAACTLGYTAVSAYVFYSVVGVSNIDLSIPDMRFGLIVLGGSFILGLLFVVGGIAVLSSKPRRSE